MDIDIDVDKDYYAVLGVSPSATMEEIKHVYRELARRYHPDSRPEDTATALFHEVQAAYAVLADPQNRRAYDRQRAELGLSEESALSWEIVLSQDKLYTAHEDQVLYLLINVQPVTTSRDERLPLNLCLVIDCSTSMQGARLQHVKQAAYQIIDALQDDDALAVVTFNDRAEVVLPSQVGISVPHAKAKLSVVRAEGGTEIFQGVQTGLSEIEKHHGENVVSHLILLTDGQTYGDEKDCIAAARRAKARRIGITAMGIGEDWNDTLLDKMASKSGGASYIASPGQVQTLLREKVRGLETTFAQDLNLMVRSADNVRLESAFLTSPYLQRLASAKGLIKLGALEAASPMKIVLELGVGQRSAGKHRLLQLELTGDVPALGRKKERLRRDVSCVFTDDETSTSYTDVPAVVLSELTRVTLYRMQEQAWDALEKGRVDQATRRLEMVATRLLDLGERRLAREAMLEAGRIAGGGVPSDRGRKELKYGTRSLTIASRRKSYD